MKNLWILLLVGVVGAAAFVLGQRSRSEPAVAAAPQMSAAESAAAQASEADRSNDPSSQPVRTFRGPDGMPNIIIYDPSKLPDNQDPAQIRAALLDDMRNHPRNIERAYDLSAEQIAAILAGKQPIPAYMLPKPAAKG